MLLISILVIILALLIALVQFLRVRQQQVSRGSMSKNQAGKTQPTLSSSPNTSMDKIYQKNRKVEVRKKQEPHIDDEDPDVVLGLKSETRARPFDKNLQKSAAEHAPIKIPTTRVVLYLKANKDCPYGGYELLQALLTYGFRYGEMDIFHRYEQQDGQDVILFSLAAATPTGTFDLGKMGNFSCAGLTTFLTLNDLAEPLNTFDLMLETAQQLVEDLGGTILDEKQQSLTQETLLDLRESIRSFEANLIT